MLYKPGEAQLIQHLLLGCRLWLALVFRMLPVVLLLLLSLSKEHLEVLLPPLPKSDVSTKGPVANELATGVAASKRGLFPQPRWAPYELG